ELAAEFESGSAARAGFAQGRLGTLMSRYGQRDIGELTTEILGLVLDSVMSGGGVPWPRLESLATTRSINWSSTGLFGLRDEELFLRSDSLPAGVLARVRPPARLITT